MSDNNINWDETTVDEQEQTENFARFDDEEDFLSDNPINQDVVSEPDQTMFESGKHKKDINLGYTSVAVILIAVLVLVLIFLGVLDRVSVVKKTPQQTQQVQQGVVEDTGKNDSGVNQKDTSESPKNNSTDVQNQEPVKQNTEGLRELPADTVMDYAGDIVKAKGTIHDKVKYLSGDMVVYCLKINASIGGKSQMVDYYCGYNVFNSVSTGDEVTVDYQFVSRNCFSVNTISK